MNRNERCYAIELLRGHAERLRKTYRMGGLPRFLLSLADALEREQAVWDRLDTSAPVEPERYAELEGPAP